LPLALSGICKVFLILFSRNGFQTLQDFFFI
jgi:hypothetical protein